MVVSAAPVTLVQTWIFAPAATVKVLASPWSSIFSMPVPTFTSAVAAPAGALGLAAWARATKARASTRGTATRRGSSRLRRMEAPEGCRHSAPAGAGCHQGQKLITREVVNTVSV